MLPNFVRLFSIMLCVLYTFSKLLGLNKPAHLAALADICFCLLVSFAASIIWKRFPALVVPFMAAPTVAYIVLLKRTSLEITVSAVILSYGISYATYTVSALCVSSAIMLIKPDRKLDFIYPSFISSALQLAVMRLPYKIKRLKKGMPFLINKGGTNAGVIISVILLCGAIMLFTNNTEYFYVIPAASILICATLVLLWWRNGIKKLYLSRLKENELQRLYELLKEKDKRIEYLERQNAELSKIIHKDNKLIPAMELAVRAYLGGAGDETLREKGLELAGRLEEMSRERFEVLNAYQAENKALPLTNVASIDALFAYMLGRAAAGGVSFDLSLTGSVRYMLESVVSESDLNTLLADLIENALIAVKNSAAKKVLVGIGAADDIYFVSVYDSGEPFPAEVLESIGKKRITTHAGEGGSGIGLMTLHEIISAHKASLLIEQLDDNAAGYAKRVCILFDGLGRLEIDTPCLNKKEQINSP